MERATRPSREAALLVPCSANRAFDLTRNANFRELHRARFQHDQPTFQRLPNTAQNFERLCRLHGTDDAHQGGEDAQGGTLGFQQCIVGWKNTGIAGRFLVA